MTCHHAWKAAIAAMVMTVCLCPAAAIEIDGNMDDWTGGAVFEMPPEALAQVRTSFAAVERLWVAHDDTFLYFRIRFARARPFTDETQSGFPEGYWDNQRYIVLDVTGDGRADYWTNQIRSAEAGLNRTYVVDLSGERPATYLWHEGHADWSPASGPMGHYSPDGREIEIRVPREPLNIQGATIGVQVQMSLRDGIEGPNAWTNDRYPSPDTYFVYDIAAAAAVAPVDPAGPPTVQMVRTDIAPGIDGVLDDAAWEGKPVLDGFILNRGNAAAQAQTRAQVTWDDRALYLGIRAEEPRMDLLTTEAVEAEARRVWRDDLIELFVGFHNDGLTFTQLGISAVGATVGQFGVVRGAARTTIDIEPDIEVAWRHGDDHWIIEAAIGWSTFGVRPRPGEVWALNVNRGRPHAGEYSSWAGVQGSFQQPRAFGEMVFPHDDGLRVLSRGMVARAGNATQANTFVAQLPGAPLTATVSVETAGGESFGDRVSAGPGETLRLPYVCTGDQGETVAFTLTSNGASLYQATLPVVQTEFPKVWVTRDPVFEELLGDQGPGMAAEGVLYWSHDLVGYSILPVVVKHAQPWTLRGAYELAARHNLHYLDGGTLLGRDPFETVRFAEELGVKIIAMGSQRAGTDDTPRADNGYAYIIDYANQEVYLERLRDYITQWREHVWGVSTGDEVQDHQLTLGLKFHYEGEPYPFMEQVDREVREEFGYGRFGIPESLDDRNPFRWIAYRRWYNDRFADFQRRIYEMVKEIDEDLVVIGPDPVAQIQPFDYSGHGRWCDVVTHQTYPRGAQEQDTAWITKTVRDLSGGAAVMPCVHVENYANSYRPDEVRELMSQVYRGGGEGFHLYLPDTTGRRTPHNMELDRFGSWPRHETIMGVLETSRTMNRPVLPASNAAILFSNDAYMAEFLGGRQGNDPYRWMFQLIGPYAGGWFTVISDNQVGRGDIALSDYAVIYLPKAQYQRREIAEALEEWVQAGGTLIVTEPEAFTWHLDGSEMSDLRARLFPAAGEATASESVMVAEGSPLALDGELPVFGSAVSLQLAQGDRPLLAFRDGSVAACVRPAGEGEVWSFGFNPMTQRALGSRWVDFWRAVHAAHGEDTDLPIWRFTLPPVEAAVIQPPPGRCLTGNYHVWDTNEAVPVANVEVAGSYSYSVAPDWIRDEGGEQDIPFSRGDLVDRRSALQHADEDYEAHLRKFAVGWQTTEPLTIEFDLGEAFLLDRVWILMGSSLPAVRASGLVDGQWRDLGDIPAAALEHRRDFPERIIRLAEDAPPIRQMRVEIAQREEGQRLIIPEVEIWSRE